MSKKHIFTPSFFAMVLLPAVMSGCSLLDQQSSPNVTVPPPYWQSQSQQVQQSQEQLVELQAFHEKESAEILEDIHIVRNREMERLETASKELKKEEFWEKDDTNISEHISKWTSWFKKKG